MRSELMPAYRDSKRGTWYASFHYKDFTGKDIHAYKRGFCTKREALRYEAAFKANLSHRASIPFSGLIEHYMNDMSSRLKPTTLETKQWIIDTHILPYFKNRKVDEIDVVDIREWQDELMKQRTSTGKQFSQTYLKTIHSQLSALFNYAIKIYGLQTNPCQLAGAIGKASADNMSFYTKEQFDQFIAAEDNPAKKIALETLFWTGMRAGELLALTMDDITPDRISVNKNFAIVKNQQMLLTPKTEKAIRSITIPHSLYLEYVDYTSKLYGYRHNERIFYFTRQALDKEMIRLADKSNLPRIRLHDLRHSHVSMLIEMGTPIEQIADRLGHESVKTTWDTYGHLYPGKDVKIASALEEIRSSDKNPENTSGAGSDPVAPPNSQI